MLNKFVIYLGLNDGEAGVQLVSTEQAVQDVVRMAGLFGFDGLTIQNAHGYWKGAAEDSLIIILFSECEDAVHGLARLLKLSFNQEAVLLESKEGGVLI